MLNMNIFLLLSPNSRPQRFPGEFDASTGVRNAKEQSFQSPTSKLPGPKVVTAGLAQYTRRPLSFSSLPQPLSCETLCLDEHTFYDPLVKCSFEWMKLRQSASEARTIYGAKVFCRSAFSRLRLPASCRAPALPQQGLCAEQPPPGVDALIRAAAFTHDLDDVLPHPIRRATPRGAAAAHWRAPAGHADSPMP